MWLAVSAVCCLDFEFQSTHPYRVWLGKEWLIGWLVVFQSTHPYRVWPYRSYQPDYLHSVSIHTPIQGVTFISFVYFCHRKRFNPHTHTGCDLLAWVSFIMAVSFNPHTHTGCDSPTLNYPGVLPCFNPHTHTGCDSLICLLSALMSSFNPHTHTGCDLFRLTSLSNLLWFQSTHPYRVWQ